MSDSTLVAPVLALPDFQAVPCAAPAYEPAVLPPFVGDCAEPSVQVTVDAAVYEYNLAACEMLVLRADERIQSSLPLLTLLERCIHRINAAVVLVRSCADIFSGRSLAACVHFRMDCYSTALSYVNAMHRDLMLEVRAMQRLQELRLLPAKRAAHLFVHGVTTRLTLIKQWEKFAHRRAAESAAEAGAGFLCICKHRVG